MGLEIGLGASSTKISLLTELGFLDADEHKVVEHAFRRQRDVHNPGEIHFEDRQEQFHARAADHRRQINRVFAMRDGDGEKVRAGNSAASRPSMQNCARSLIACRHHSQTIGQRPIACSRNPQGCG